MALTVHGFQSTTSAYRIVQETASGATVLTDVVGSGGSIYCITIVNSDNSNQGVTKFFLRSRDTPTLGTTEPDLALYCAANTSARFEYPQGLSFKALTFATTRNFATSDTTAPGTTKVILLCR